MACILKYPTVLSCIANIANIKKKRKKGQRKKRRERKKKYTYIYIYKYIYRCVFWSIASYCRVSIMYFEGILSYCRVSPHIGVYSEAVVRRYQSPRYRSGDTSLPGIGIQYQSPRYRYSIPVSQVLDTDTCETGIEYRYLGDWYRLTDTWSILDFYFWSVSCVYLRVSGRAIWIRTDTGITNGYFKIPPNTA